MKRIAPAALSMTLGMSLSASLALAHQGVTDPTVLARMDSMKVMSASVKVIGDMTKGETDFDAAEVAAALARLKEESAKIPALFEAEIIPKTSEALPIIWQNWDAYVKRAQTLDAALAGISVEEVTDLRPAMKAIGSGCRGCHDTYRK
jgi:cytochrome c556